jgi:hypothetical protein
MLVYFQQSLNKQNVLSKGPFYLCNMWLAASWVECLFIEVPFHQNGFSSNGLFIEYTIVSNFQNCKQNFCSTSSKSSIFLNVEVLQKFCLQFWKLDEIVHSMNKPFDEKPFLWKGASMKRHSTMPLVLLWTINPKGQWDVYYEDFQTFKMLHLWFHYLKTK